MKNGYGKRRKYFIDKEFQTTFILRFCVVVILSSFLMGGLIFVFSENSTTVTIEDMKVMAKPMADFIFPILSITVFIVAVFSALVVCVLTLLTSHKIAGPIFRISQEIDLLKEGHLGRKFTLRNKDQFQPLAKSLSEMTHSLKEKHVALKSDCDEITAYLQGKDFCVSSKDKKKLEASLKKLNTSLAYFKIS